MRKIDGLEGEILKKYLTGRILDEVDRFYVEEMATVGLMNTGYSLKQEKETAKTTYLGRACI